MATKPSQQSRTGKAMAKPKKPDPKILGKGLANQAGKALLDNAKKRQQEQNKIMKDL